MIISVVVAQFPISLSVRENIEAILEFLDQVNQGELVVFPEGSVSGYSKDIAFLKKINQKELSEGLAILRAEAQKRTIYLWVGACVKEKGGWLNAAFGFTPQNEQHVYHKINLAHHERGVIVAGNELPVFDLKMPSGRARFGVQLCRELRYPEQWGWLARSGAQVILHLNNAIDDDKYQSVWKSHLISRAAETQRFIISVNNAASERLCPTMIIAPDGCVLGEITSSEKAILRGQMDLSRVSDWYIDQCRDDVVAIKAAN